MSDTQITAKQKAARLYYLRNRERCIQHSTAYRLRNEEKFKAYQAHYYRNYKQTPPYRQRLDRERDKRHNSKTTNQPPITQELPQSTPLPLEQVETAVDEIKPVFSVVRPPPDKIFCVSFS